MRGPVIPRQASEKTFLRPSAQREYLTSARHVKPSTIQLRFADKAFSLAVKLLGMPIDRIHWETVAASPTGESMIVEGIKGEMIPIDSSTLRYLVDPVYAAEMDAALKAVQFSREELQEMARDNPLPSELLAPSEQDLTSESWK